MRNGAPRGICALPTEIRILAASKKVLTLEQHLPLEVLKKFRVVFGSVRQHFREIEQSCGISGSQLWILNEIAQAPGLGVSELAERLSIHQTTCSQLVEKLVGRKLLIKERLKQDQRRVGLTLTVAGLATLARAPGPAQGILPEALSGLPETALKSLDSNLADLIGRLKVLDEDDSGRPLADL